jgi:penicillin-binding protein 1C
MKRILFGIGLFLIVANGGGKCFAAPSYREVRASYSSSDAALLDRHGEVIQQLRVDLHGRRLSWTRLRDVSPALVKAVLCSEDRRFSEHHGVDWRAVAAAAFGKVFGSGRRGASTVTMQLASLLGAGLRPETGGRTIGQKWKQMRAARDLERSWTKREVLEAYLNLVTFRGELQGIAAASWGLFDKSPGGLDEEEAVILAALIRSPNAPAERVGKRAALLANALGWIVPRKRIERAAVPGLAKASAIRRRIDLAPQAALRLIRGRARRVSCTLDASLQRFVSETLRRSVAAFRDQNMRDGAVLVVDNATGEVLAYVGNTGDLSSARYVDGVRAHRQAGSTLKPFLYSLVIERKILTAASLIEDAPLEIPTGRGVYRPGNYDNRFRGLVTVRTALASSLNVPAVRTLELVGPEAFVRRLSALGFTGLSSPEHYGPSIALGSADVSLWDLVNAYRTLANGGVRTRLRLSPDERQSPRRHVVSRGAAFIVSSILSDREARSATFSLESPLATRFWSAVKTGTSKDMRDNWCVGYSDRYTVGVWVGNFSGASMWDVSGVSGAAPIWSEIMNYLNEKDPGTAPRPPAGVVSRVVGFREGSGRTLRQEWFIAGTERSAAAPERAEHLPKIVYPTQGMIIAVDPDIPRELQRVFIETSPPDSVQRIVLDRRDLGPAPVVSWDPAPGKHELSLVGPEGVEADRIYFEVR